MYNSCGVFCVKGSTVTKLARCIIFALKSRKLYAPQVIMMPRGLAQVYTCTTCCSFGHCRSIQQGSVICTTTSEVICLIQSTRLTSEGCSISLSHWDVSYNQMNSGLPLQKVLVRQFTGQQKAMVELQSAVRIAYAKNRIFPFMAVTCSLSNSGSSMWYSTYLPGPKDFPLITWHLSLGMHSCRSGIVARQRVSYRTSISSQIPHLQ